MTHPATVDTKGRGLHVTSQQQKNPQMVWVEISQNEGTFILWDFCFFQRPSYQIKPVQPYVGIACHKIGYKHPPNLLAMKLSIPCSCKVFTRTRPKVSMTCVNSLTFSSWWFQHVSSHQTNVSHVFFQVGVDKRKTNETNTEYCCNLKKTLKDGIRATN